MSKRRRAERKGRAAELFAALFLMAKGYRPLAWRVKTGRGEIDLVMRFGRDVIFVEVKTRSDLDAALCSVTQIKTRRTIDAARIWLAQNTRLLDCNCRFDILLLAAYHWPRHIKSAYDGGQW
jgi:putative endonuclease